MAFIQQPLPDCHMLQVRNWSDDAAAAGLLLSQTMFTKRPGVHVVHVASEMVPIAKVRTWMQVISTRQQLVNRETWSHGAGSSLSRQTAHHTCAFAQVLSQHPQCCYGFQLRPEAAEILSFVCASRQETVAGVCPAAAGWWFRRCCN